ncbi:MAG: hypothetical protein IPL32_09765 [Chloracidobacterium sp.]|nr:hypothetical protein [Chloracidobacterium sp.]
MAFLEGKTETEKKQIIAAAVLGVVALIALYFAFGRSFFGGSTTTATVTVKITATPTPGSGASTTRPVAVLPTASEQDFLYQTTAVPNPGSIFAPEAGRNIFAFYEPAPPCRGEDCPSPTPPPPPPVKPPTPVPTPPVLLAGFSPQSVYAGARGFKLEVTGDKFTPDSRIYFNQSELPTTFINSQKLTAEVSAKLISTEGSRQIIVQTPDGKLYSDQVMMTVQAPPRPTILYIGMIGRKRYNNDTAYLAENEKAAPFGARLNDVIGGRFRLIDISAAEVVFEDTSLGFKHRVPISKGILIGSVPPGRGTDLNQPGVPTYPPGFIPQDVPGIPNNIPQYNPNPEQRKMEMQKQQQQKEDVNDEDG